MPLPSEQISGTIHEVHLLQAQRHVVHGLINSDLLDHIDTTDYLHDDPELQMRAACTTVTKWWKPMRRDDRLKTKRESRAKTRVFKNFQGKIADIKNVINPQWNNS